MANSADPDQLASSEANWSGSTLFAKTGQFVFSKRRVKYSDAVTSCHTYHNKTKFWDEQTSTNSIDPYQMLQKVMYDVGLHYFWLIKFEGW